MTTEEPTYSKFNIEEFSEKLLDFQASPKKREFVIQIGAAGLEMYHVAMEAEILKMRRETAKTTLHDSIQNGTVPLSGRATYIKMIESDDLETIQLAETLLEIKNK